jgi:hypothetical protein
MIPLGRLTKKTIDDYRKKKTMQWLRPEYTRVDRKPRRELYIPVQPGVYTATATDHVFDFVVFIGFLGRGFVRRLLDLLPPIITESPIYVRHTARFRGFLDRYFEPSGMFKSRTVLSAGLLGFFFFTGMFGMAASLTMSSGSFRSFFALAPLLAFGILLLAAAFSPIDGYVKLTREHGERMAWESVILSPISGKILLSGSFGVLLAHRWIPIIPAGLVVLIAGLVGGQSFFAILAILVFLYSLFLAGLSYGAGLSWFIANRLLAACLLTVWAAGWALVIYLLSTRRLIGGPEMLLDSLFEPQYLDPRQVAILFLTALVFFVIGAAMPSVLGSIFDRYARYPLVRREEQAE